MANIDLNGNPDIDLARQLARRSAHIQRTRLMLAAAGLTTLGILSIAGTMLTTAF